MAMSSWNLEGKHALVTGGSKGIGKAIVGEFLSLGAEVVFTARNEAKVAAAAHEFRQSGYPVHGIVADVVLDQDRKKLAEWIGSQWGGLDILVNNAGMNIRKRVAEPSEIAAAVAFLAMDRASYITGHNLSVDGGATSGLL
jgi:Tropinone reductase 1